MKITICSRAVAMEPMSDRVVRDMEVLESLDGYRYGGSSGNIADYIDMELADIGIIGGTSRCSFSHADGLRLCTDYWAPRALGPGELEQLEQYTIGQWEDGVGEDGFHMDLKTTSVDVFALCDEEDVSVEQLDDGTAVRPPSQVAICARDGDVDGLINAIQTGETVEGTLLGYSALHLAILYGSVDSALILIQHGADVNRPDSQGDSPLHLCATSNALSDEESTTIALALISAGADRNKLSSTGEATSELAELRGKEKLIEALA